METVGDEVHHGVYRQGRRDVDDAALLPGHHPVEPVLRDQIDRVHAERRADEPIPWARHAAALDMAQDGNPRLRPGQLGDALTQVMSDSAVSRLFLISMVRFSGETATTVPRCSPPTMRSFSSPRRSVSC